MKKLITFLLISSFITSCGQVNSEGTAGTSIKSYRGILKNGSSTIGYVLDFLGRGLILAHITSIDRYVVINPLTGLYGSQAGLYFTGAGCSGSGYANGGWRGVVGKSVQFDGTNYWLVSSMVTTPTTITKSSQAFNATESYVTCTSASGDQDLDYGDGILTGIDRPYDFESIAPLTITYE